MELKVLLWILVGGFAGLWGLCIVLMIRSDSLINSLRDEILGISKEMQSYIRETRKEITQIYQWQREIQALMTEHSCRIKVLESPKS